MIYYIIIQLLYVLPFIALFILLAPFLYRYVRSSIRGSKYIRKPEELRNSLHHRPIFEGLELVVGYDDELKDGKLHRYSISPEVTGEATGTILRVDSFSSSHLELMKITSS